MNQIDNKNEVLSQKQKVKKNKVVSFGPIEYMGKEQPKLTQSSYSDSLDAWLGECAPQSEMHYNFEKKLPLKSIEIIYFVAAL